MHEFSGWVIFVVVATALFLGLQSLTIFVSKRMGWYPKDESAVSRAKVSP